MRQDIGAPLSAIIATARTTAVLMDAEMDAATAHSITTGAAIWELSYYTAQQRSELLEAMSSRLRVLLLIRQFR